jgi:hypothetical protein
VLQLISGCLGILPYQLFLEHPVTEAPQRMTALMQELTGLQQRFVGEMEALIKRYEK